MQPIAIKERDKVEDNPMPSDLVLRVRHEQKSLDLPATLVAVGPQATSRGESLSAGAAPTGIEVWLTGDRDYVALLRGPVDAAAEQALSARTGKSVLVVFPERSPVRRRLKAVFRPELASVTPAPGAIDLTLGREGAAPLWLLASGWLSSTKEGSGNAVDAAGLVSGARWVSSRRTCAFEDLFPASAFRPDEAKRSERLTLSQAQGLLSQLQGALSHAALSSDLAKTDDVEAAQIRSACATILAHLIATAVKDTTFRPVADAAAKAMFDLIEAESGAAGKSTLKSHAIGLLQMRAPGLSPADRERAKGLVRTLVRESPPYASLPGPWRFAMCSASEFHEGECEILKGTYKFTDVEVPADAPKPPGYGGYRVLKAPFTTPDGQPIFLFARSALPHNENHEMGLEYFTGILINRHAQLGSYDMRAATVNVTQRGYKLMMNSQCAGLTTRFAISRMFPEADIYSSWDSTYFRNPSGNLVTASEGVDCFVAVILGMTKKENHAQIEKRIQGAQWYHSQSSVPGFVQFIGPAHPLVVAKYSDVNLDGHADYYDGFLDFRLKAIAEDLYASITPRDPGVAPSQISGEAATGLNWAAGSLNRVSQYSDIWANLPGDSEGLYVFTAGGFYSHREPPADVPLGSAAGWEDLGRAPAVCRFSKSDDAAGLTCEVMVHAHLSHAAKELKRLLCAGEAMNRAFDLGYLPSTGLFATPLGRRGALLLTLAGVLEFPADQNYVDGLWSMALKQLNLPDISRSLVRGCITEADHDASNYYGSKRGLKQLIGEGESTGALAKADPQAYARLQDPDPKIGRALPLAL